MQSRKITVNGRVQGVGFRPFIFRLAHDHGVTGWVKNSSGQVDILVQGSDDQLQQFEAGIIAQHPPLAQPQITESLACDADTCSQFQILKSDAEHPADIHIPADFYACDDCLRELMDPDNRRYRYPFINCTNCGPRYTLIAQLPYDRPNTSMADFVLCEPCHQEYSNPYDRRFHAQPVACEDCGPQLSFSSADRQLQGNEASLQACVDALRRGSIVAVKGVGGYHLMCDACDAEAIARLRQRKQRPDKPFAVLFPWQGDAGTDQLVEYLQPDAEQLARLTHVSRAIVLVPGKTDSPLATNINPGLVEVGAMLPYSPLHYLISHDFGGPLVATSANFSGEPVITDNDEAQQRLADIVDAFVHHNRPIVRPADDTVLRIIDRQPQYLRLGRGSAPLELALPFRLQQPLLAVGGHMKNTIALAWDNRVVISPHIGDLSSARSLRVFEQVINDLQALYQVSPQQVICDAHPEYASHRWARQYCQQNFRILHTVYHHHAHASALCGEYPEESRWLVFTWDGTGFGPDQSIWGGEALLGSAGDWQRVMRFRPFSILGGDRVATEPWRSAAALCWEQGIDWRAPQVDNEFAYQAWQKNQGCFSTSAVGRMFDAAACLIMGIDHCSFDGQAPMNLEQMAAPLREQAIELPLQQVSDELQQVDWSPLLPMLLQQEIDPAERSALFHSSLGMSLLAQAERLRDQQGDFAVGLSGGVFQNKKLTEFVLQRLREQGFRVFTTGQIPCNDAGISYGQILDVHKDFLYDEPPA